MLGLLIAQFYADVLRSPDYLWTAWFTRLLQCQNGSCGILRTLGSQWWLLRGHYSVSPEQGKRTHNGASWLCIGCLARAESRNLVSGHEPDTGLWIWWRCAPLVLPISHNTLSLYHTSSPTYPHTPRQWFPDLLWHPSSSKGASCSFFWLRYLDMLCDFVWSWPIKLGRRGTPVSAAWCT